MGNWKQEPVTEKQKKLIMEMREFSEHSIPVFVGTTKGEAADYIDKWLAISHKTFVSTYELSH